MAKRKIGIFNKIETQILCRMFSNRHLFKAYISQKISPGNLIFRNLSMYIYSLYYFIVFLSAKIRQRFTPRHNRFKLFICRIFATFGQNSQKMRKIAINVKIVPFGCLNNTHNCCTCISTLLGIAEQEVLTIYNVAFYKFVRLNY